MCLQVNNDGKLDNEEVTELLGKIQGIDTATCSPSTKAKLAEEVKSIFKEVDEISHSLQRNNIIIFK